MHEKNLETTRKYTGGLHTIFNMKNKMVGIQFLTLDKSS